MFSKAFKRTVSTICIIAAMAGVVYSQQFVMMQYAIFDANFIERKEAVNSKFIKPFLFGHEAFYADLFWIHSIRWSVERGVPGLATYLTKMLDVVTDLDPRFEQAYIWGASAITFAYSSDMDQIGRVKAANKLLHKGWDYIQNDEEGWEHFSSYWMIPQVLSFNYGFELKDREKALEYNHALMSIPNLPVHLKTWAAGLYRKGDDKQKGLSFLENLLAVETLQSQINMTDDDAVKERLRGKMIAFYDKLNTSEYGDQRIAFIQNQVKEMVDAWRKDYKFIPFSLYVLIHQRKEESTDSELYSIFFPNLNVR